MLASLTGYGRIQTHDAQAAVTAEVRTVNHRSLDVHVRISREYAALEPELIQEVRRALRRGRVDLFVSIEKTGEVPITVNVETVRGYVEAARRLQAEFQLGGSLELASVLSLPGVVKNRAEDEPDGREQTGIRANVIAAVRAALGQVVEMRVREGAALAEELHRHLASLETATSEIRDSIPAEREATGRRFEERLSQLLPREGLDPVRIAQEVAIMAERADISEEIERLESHVEQFRGLLADGKEVGKKMDFLLQEMQREANTILSKSNSLGLTRLGLAARADVEKMREQVQNVE